MNLPKGETRQELLNRAFLYVLLISISVLIFLRVKSLIFDLFVAVVLAALAEPIVYRISKKSGRKFAAFFTVVSILLIITGILFSIIPVMVEELYFLSTQLPTYLDNILDYVVMDVDSNEMILNGREEIKEKLGHVDLLINNAGITADNLFLRMSKYHETNDNQ